jgi:Bacterial Ig-like domain (group 2)/Kelch motif/Galactose oxidase, central domain
MDFRIASAAIAAVSSLLLSACGGGGGSPSTSTPPPTSTYRATSGVAEKGPLINGSTVTAQELDASLAPTGRQYSYQITSDLGTFEPTSTFTSQYLGINASGYYFDEVQGAVSSGPVTLNGCNDLAANDVVNVNILTTLAYQRIRNLVANSQLTFAQARRQGEREVLSALNIPLGSYEPFGTLDLRSNTEESRLLAAISALFVNGNNAGELSVLINNFQNDLGTNGVLTNATTVAALAAAARNLDANTVAANLNQRYASLGVTFTPGNITDWIDQDGDGLVGKFKFSLADSSPSTIFTFPTAVVERMAGMSIAASAGLFAVNGTPVTSPVTVHTGDTLTLSPNAGSFPNGVLNVYLYSGNTKLARVSFVSGLLAIDVTPATPSVAKGLTQQFTATGTFSDGRTLDLSNSVTWVSSSPAVATLSAAGLAQTLALGSTTVTATSGSVSNSTLFSVTAAVPVSLSVTPNPLRSGVGITLQPTATATYSDGTTADVTHLATWTSSEPSVASIDPLTGLITGVSLGSSAIESTVGSLTETVPLALVTNEWSPGGNLLDARIYHTATLLPSGKVLVIGGGSELTARTAELYDPVKRTWSPAGNLLRARRGHTATLLPSGRVLVTGGLVTPPPDGTNNIPPTTEVDIYDPLSNNWSRGPDLLQERNRHTATLLADGKVLVAGGADMSHPNATASAELYDPSTNTWSPAGSMMTARSDCTATLLANGMVLVVGGLTDDPAADLYNPPSTPTAELYNPATNTWMTTTSLTYPRSQHTATLLPNGTVLVAGGYASRQFPAVAEIYDPVSGTWSQAGSMVRPRVGHSATLLPNGRVLFVAGSLLTDSKLTDVETYDPPSSTWSAAPSLSTGRDRHTATLLPNGVVLVTGGSRGGGLMTASTELYW